MLRHIKEFLSQVLSSLVLQIFLLALSFQAESSYFKGLGGKTLELLHVDNGSQILFMNQYVNMCVCVGSAKSMKLKMCVSVRWFVSLFAT